MCFASLYIKLFYIGTCMKTPEEKQGHMYGHFPASVLDTGLRTREDFTWVRIVRAGWSECK